jgi:hypothetical protein
MTGSESLPNSRLKSRPNWPGAAYDATPGELAAIEGGLGGGAASEEEVKTAFALFLTA